MQPNTQELAPPPLTRWGWTWRYLVAAVVSVLSWLSVAEAEWSEARWLFWLGLFLGVVAFPAYAFHRRRPVGVATGLAVFALFSMASAGPSILAFVSMCTRRRWREVIAVGGLSIGAGVGYELISPGGNDPWVVTVVVNALVIGVAAAVGLYVGARRELVATLRDRAERAEREQAMRIAQARTNERSRIAREMHDVLAHRISLVAMHAGALSFRTDLTPQQTAQAADVIQQNAHQALSDLREILGVLRDGDQLPVGERPQPTLRDLERLIEEERQAGAHIRLATAVPLDDVPTSIGRSAFRMVQESLTNARKHAPDTTVDVRLEGEAGGSLRVEVRNPLRVGAPGRSGASGTSVPGAGLGLIGLAERADLSGGGLEHFTTPQGEFVLRAWLPWPS